MNTLPACPECGSAYTYEDGAHFACPECAHEWTDKAEEAGLPNGEKKICDAVGQPLHDGDAVTLIKDLKVKGTSSVLKMGTRVKNIRLIEGDHDIDCKIEGFGAMKLKSCFVKKAG